MGTHWVPLSHLISLMGQSTVETLTLRWWKAACIGLCPPTGNSSRTGGAEEGVGCRGCGEVGLVGWVAIEETCVVLVVLTVC